jgi:hypothetical protein
MTIISINTNQECTLTECPLKSLCAQHESADEVRKLTNFRPHLLIDIDSNEIICNSSGTKDIAKSHLNIKGYFKFQYKP